MHCGWVISGLFALLALCWSGDAPAQSVQCLQETDRAARNRCAEREIDDLRDAVRYWRRAAGQTEADVAYFENARARCRGEPACVAREYQIEMSELQVTIEPARRAQVASGWMGPAVYELEGAPTDLPRLLDAIIMDDSRHWLFNSYDRGSVRNVRVTQSTDGYHLVHADYSYNRGRPGWVRAQVVGERVRCLEYHDYQGRCRPIGAQSYAYGDAANFAFQMFWSGVLAYAFR